MSIDFETGSQADLKKVGAANYAADPTTRVICVAYNTPWHETAPLNIVCDWVKPGWRWVPPKAMVDWISDGKPVRAWNAMFEYWIWLEKVTDLNAGIPFIQRKQLHDTMAQAAYWGLPLSLDTAGQALPELGIVKDKAGHALMKRMSRPRGVDDTTGELRWWDDEDQDKRDALMAYCKQDVRTEMAIGDHLPPLPDRERKIWLMDARVNARGMKLDRKLALNMKKVALFEQARLDKELADETGGFVTGTNRVKALSEWCVAQGLPDAADGLAKDRLPMLISKADEAGLFAVSNALAIRQEAAKSSVAKLDAMLNFAGMDDNMRGLTQYYGAFRTGRWAGRGPQIQNFPRSEVKNQGVLVDIFRGQENWGLMESQTFEAVFGVSPLTGVSSALRGCIWVPEEDGHFASLDFSQIEARVLAWLAGSDKILDAYRSGKDLYVLAASGIYKVPEAQVDGDQRQVGKVSVLALGYQGGVGAFQTMAKVYGLTIEDELAEDIKTKWREANPEIVSYWWDVQKAAIDAVKDRGRMVEVRRGDVRVMFSSWKGHLVCRLPSGRDLIYRDAQVGQGTYGDELTYMGLDQYTRQWKRISTYGGKLVENITQAVARDCMADAMLRFDELNDVRVLGSVHDEALLWLRKSLKPSSWLKILSDVMCDAPGSWAKGLPLEADGYVGRRFRK